MVELDFVITQATFWCMDKMIKISDFNSDAASAAMLEGLISAIRVNYKK